MNLWPKRFILVLLSLIMVWGVTGCMNKKPNPEAIKEQMLRHLEGKYGEEFVPMSLSLSDWAYGHDTLYAYPKKGTENDSFEVWGTKKDDGTYAIHDGYFGILIKPQYEKVMSGFVGEIYDEFKLYTNFGEGILPDRLNKDTKIEDIYNEDELFTSDTVIFVKEDSAKGIDDEESILTIAKRMQANKMVGKVRLFIVLDDKYEAIGLDSLNINPTKEDEYYLHERKVIKVSKDLKIMKYGEEGLEEWLS